MAIYPRINGIRSVSYLLNRLKTLISNQQRWKHTSETVMEINQVEAMVMTPSDKAWKTVDSRTFGIKKESILPSITVVLKTLQTNGYVAYLVGGCVRDLILKRTPKDFDVITTASLKQIKKHFRRCIIIGRRFPICQVYISGNVIEVSSFNTIARSGDKQKEIILPKKSSNCNNRDLACWKNCMERDFTINCLFFDPFKFKIYDFVGGLKDLRASKVRTVIPPHLAFKEDCAKILRGMRIAARLGLKFSKETETAIQDLSSSVLTLNKERLMLEMNFMMAHGAAVSSINLLERFKLLEILLPAQATYLASQSNNLSAQMPIMLMELLMNADKLLRADHPCSCNLWLGLLAFHLALVHNPQDSLVIWTFSSILYHGTWNEAVAYVRGSSDNLIHFVPEILSSSVAKADELLLEETSRFASLVKSSIKALTDSEVLQQSLAKYNPPLSAQALIFVSPNMGRKVSKLFDVDICINGHCKEEDNSSKAKKAENLHSKKGRERHEINYELLKKGDLNESRIVLGKIIMDTMKGAPISEAGERMIEGENKIVSLSSLF
ncbi:uncharacterized protein LOC110022613 [Phalaenopsis equestris]|uniref:uncharacterized protein LOC110022613 n=1 Tax=Phalaenopsis equestris TaxID=78828 RepID=UPI0009E1CA16|nr:uncharacterized protein LOC110022613 [Phalaenopsis equestris]